MANKIKRSVDIKDFEKDNEDILREYLKTVKIEKLRKEIEKRELDGEAYREIEAETKINAHSSKRVYDEEYYKAMTKAQRQHAKRVAEKRARRMYGEQMKGERVTQTSLFIAGIILFISGLTIVFIPQGTFSLPLGAMSLMIGIVVIIYVILSVGNNFLYRQNIKAVKASQELYNKTKTKIKEKTEEKELTKNKKKNTN